MMEQTVAAVIVTYNRKLLLSQCVAALLQQTVSLQTVIIIDNASTDGTKAQLAAAGYLNHNSIIYQKLSENSGGAGGFYAGIKRAMTVGADWIWLMDDDTIPTTSALEKLINKQREFTPPVPYLLASKVLWTDDTLHPMNIPAVKKTNADQLFHAAQYATFSLRSTSFVSLFIHRTLVEKYGYPIQDYFIWNDDVEYTARLLKAEFGVVVPDSIVYHKTVKKYVPFTDGGDRYYYEVRNKIWMLFKSDSWSTKEKILISGHTLAGIWQYIFGKKFTFRKMVIVGKGLIAGFGTAPQRRGD